MMRTESSEAPAPPAGETSAEETAYLALHAEREELERNLALAQARQRFGADLDAAAARVDEEAMLRQLDRVLTLIRAAEYKRRPGARRW
ncbi:hypothetical protein [Methylobacterium nigriterrae]|uniref:hypothetical protein n=1 Tax=Methylobacterium nigriterrae TaxID=3127512 RepID=UPI003D6697AF